MSRGSGVLDIFHVLEHITAAGQALNSDPDRASAWITKAREALLHEGWSGIDALTRAWASPDEVPRSAAHQQTIGELRNDLSPHADHLHDAERWQEGRVNRMAGLCSLLYSDQWAPYWETA